MCLRFHTHIPVTFPGDIEDSRGTDILQRVSVRWGEDGPGAGCGVAVLPFGGPLPSYYLGSGYCPSVSSNGEHLGRQCGAGGAWGPHFRWCRP